MEASALHHSIPIGMRGPTPLLRLQSDERLIALVRRGNHAAFETLVARYQTRLLAFCRHMLGSREDAEDVLQEVFAAAFNAILGDDRPINVRPWLYRIARNRSLNHLRRVQPIGVDSMDVHLSEGGVTTADKVHKREEFRLLVADVQDLPETQKTALLLREIDALSYEQIAEAMETTIPSVKSLLVRARVSLAEAAEARTLSCDQVREELGEVAEGLCRSTAPARRHVRGCDRCQGFKAQLRSTNRALAVVFPAAPLLLFKKVLLTHFGMTASAGAGGAAGAAAATVAATGGTSAISAGVSTIATKTAATLAAAAIVTAGAVEVKHVQTKAGARAVPAAKATPVPAPAPAARVAPVVVAAAQQPTAPAKAKPKPAEPTVTAAQAKPESTKPTSDPTAVPEPAATTKPVAAAAAPAPGEAVTDTAKAGEAPVPVAPTGGTAAPSEPVAAPETAPKVPAAPPPAPAEPDPDLVPAAAGTGGVKARPRAGGRRSARGRR